MRFGTFDPLHWVFVDGLLGKPLEELYKTLEADKVDLSMALPLEICKNRSFCHMHPEFWESSSSYTNDHNY